MWGETELRVIVDGFGCGAQHPHGALAHAFAALANQFNAKAVPFQCRESESKSAWTLLANRQVS